MTRAQGYMVIALLFGLGCQQDDFHGDHLLAWIMGCAALVNLFFSIREDCRK